MKKILVLIFVLGVSVAYGHDEVPEFEGYVGVPTEETDNLFKRFNDFMLENEGNVVHLRLTLDSTQHAALKDPTDDFYFFAVYDNYDERMTGIEYHFMKSKMPASWTFNTDKNVVDGYFRVESITGPQNGLLVVEMVRIKKIKN